jgi:hypothetical protein
MSAQPRVLATAIFFLGAANACLAADLTQWAWRNPLPQGNPLYAAACSPARCVAVGEGALLTSTDGESWSAQPLPDGLQYAGGVIYAAGQFVAAGGSGYGIATSTDGLDWTARAPGVELNAVAYGNGTFVAVGPMGAVLTSSDGASWIPASSGSTQNLAAVAFGNGRFVATNAAAAGKGSVLVSTDGVHWTPAEAGTAYNQAVTFGAGRFVVAGSGTSVATSTDGSIWTEAPLGAYANLLGIAHGAGRFVAVGDQGAVYTSTNATAWGPGSSPTSAPLQGIVWTEGRFVAVGWGGGIYTSPDGLQFTARQRGTGVELTSGVAAGGRIVVVGWAGTVLTSDDGVTFTPRATPTAKNLLGVTRCASRFVAVGAGGVVLTSDDGADWAEQPAGTSEDLNAVTCGDGVVIAAGNAGTIVRSPDGVSFGTVASPPPINRLYGVTHGNGTFVAVGIKLLDPTARTLRSTDGGLTWSPAAAQAATQTLWDVEFGGGSFVAVGEYGTLVVSADGSAWTKLTPPSSAWLYGVAHGGGRFLAVGRRGAMLTSTDGTNWSGVAAGTTVNTLDDAVPLADGEFLALGQYGTLLKSGAVPTTPLLSVDPLALEFGTVTLGAHADRTVTAQNAGAGTLTGNCSVAPPFSLPDGCSLSLAAGASRAISVRYAPDAVGAAAATLSFATTGGPASVSLAASAAAFDAAPSPLVFGDVQLGGTIEKSLTLTNAGSTALSIGAATSAPFAVVSSLPVTVPAGGSAGLALSFTAADSGTAERALTLDAGAGGTRTVLLRGGGRGLVLTPAGIDFGPVIVGSRLTAPMTFSNTAGAAVEVAVSAPAPFGIGVAGSGTELTFTLGPGEHRTETVSFEPLTLGAASAALHVDAEGVVSDAPLRGAAREARRLTVAIDGTGANRSVWVDPSHLRCDGTCEYDFAEGQRVLLSPSYDYATTSLAGWGGDADCSDGIVTLEDDRACTVRYVSSPVLTHVNPPRGGDQGTLTVVVYGGLFGETPVVTLTREGEFDRPGEFLERLSSTVAGDTILVRFNLTDAARGAWDLELRRPDGGNARLTGALMVEEATYADAELHISGDDLARIDTLCTNAVVLSNLTNNDIGISDMWFNAPDGTSFQGGFVYGDRFGAAAVHPARRTVDESGRVTYRSMIGELAAGSGESNAYDFKVHREGEFTFSAEVVGGFEDIPPEDPTAEMSETVVDATEEHLRIEGTVTGVGVNDPFTADLQRIGAGEPGEPTVDVVETETAMLLTATIPAEDQEGRKARGWSIWKWGYEISTRGYKTSQDVPRCSKATRQQKAQKRITNQLRNEGSITAEEYRDLMRLSDGATTMNFLTSVKLPPAASTYFPFLRGVMDSAWEGRLWGIYKTNGFKLDALPPDLQTRSEFSKAIAQKYTASVQTSPKRPPVKARATKKVKGGRSFDPNQISGPQGSGVANWIRAASPLEYEIEFENMKSALFPAQTVVVQAPLDAAKLDLDTLALGSVRIGTHVFTPPPGLDRFDATVDLRPEVNLLAGVSARLDREAQLLVWRYTSLDPVTAQPITDPLDGFLPPNTEPPLGQAWMRFSVRPRAGLPSGTVVTQAASIVFDTNDPIATNTWSNTLDAERPAGSVVPLAPVTYATEFPVAWSADDDAGGSGVALYEVFLMRDGDTPVPWKLGTTETFGTFRGEFGHRYAFFSVATDAAGNREIPRNEPQAETELVPLPRLTLVAGDGDFGRLLAGSAAPRRSFSLRSDGSGQVAIGALTIAGSGAAAFALENDGCSGQTLAPGASCGVDVVCTQVAAGAAAATLTIPSSDPAGPVQVPLSARIVRLLVSPTQGAAGVELTIAGSGFGTKKPKVYVGSTALAVSAASDTSIRAKLSKAASAGDYAVKVQPSVKGASAITESAAFTIRRPEPLAVSPAAVAAGETLTITGRFFGITKGKVTISAGKSLSCAVTSWPRSETGGDETIKCRVPKGLTPGPATVTVASGAGSTALAGKLTVR